MHMHHIDLNLFHGGQGLGTVNRGEHLLCQQRTPEPRPQGGHGVQTLAAFLAVIVQAMERLQGEAKRTVRPDDTMMHEERQQQAWKRKMITSAKECRAHGVPIFITPALLTQLQDKTSKKRREEALMILLEGQRMLNRERERCCQRQQPKGENAVVAGKVSSECNDDASDRTMAAGSWDVAASDGDADSGKTLAAGSWSVAPASSDDSEASAQTMAAGSWELSESDSRSAELSGDETDSSDEEAMIDEAAQTPAWESLHLVQHVNALCKKYGVPIVYTDTVVRQLLNTVALPPRQRLKLCAKVEKGLRRLRQRRYRLRYSSIVWDEDSSMVGTIVWIEPPDVTMEEYNFVAIDGDHDGQQLHECFSLMAIQDTEEAPMPITYRSSFGTNKPNSFRDFHSRPEHHQSVIDSHPWIDDGAVPALPPMRCSSSKASSFHT